MMFLLIISILISVGFFTLLERKILSLSQSRLGPNKTMMLGVIQPILDGLKLFKKSNTMNVNSINFLFILTSCFMLMISFFLWLSFPFYFLQNKILILLWMLLMFGVASYIILLMGWSSMSKYGFLGSIRSLAQSLSFEINLSLMILLMSILKNKFSLNLLEYNSYFFMMSMSFIFFILILLETQRAPMDLSEGESELVSGYNIEFGSILFAFIFMGEYTMMILLIMLMLVIFLKFFMILFILLLYNILMIRSCFPRLRYDKLMEIMWMNILPIIIMMWFFYFNFKFI